MMIFMVKTRSKYNRLIQKIQIQKIKTYIYTLETECGLIGLFMTSKAEAEYNENTNTLIQWPKSSLKTLYIAPPNEDIFNLLLFLKTGYKFGVVGWVQPICKKVDEKH